MRRSELTGDQLAQRTAVVESLAAAGWGAGGLPYNEWFELGRWVAYEAGLRYRNAHGVWLSAHYNAGKQALHLSIEDETEGMIGLVFELDDRHQTLLDVLVAVQDRLSPRDYKDSIRRLMACSPASYATIGEDGETLARLEDGD